MKELFRITRIEEPKIQSGRTNTPPSFTLKPIVISKPQTPTAKK